MKKKAIKTFLMSILLVLALFSSVHAHAAGTYYTVKQGDSLYKISKSFGISVDNLMKENNLKSTIIYPGMKLIVGLSETSPVKITVNGQPVLTDGFIHENRTFVPIRFISEMLGAEVDWFPEEKYAAVIHNQKVILLKSNESNVYVNGIHQIIDAPAMNMNGRIFVPLRFVSETGDVAVEWDGDQKIVRLTVKEGVKPAPYTQDDLYWLSRLIRAEAEGQPLFGQLAVGAVVMNRVYSKDFPDTVKEVIFQPKQFTPAANGTIYKEPGKRYETVAKMVLNGFIADREALFFLNPDKSTSFWIVNNKTYVASIGDHDFYK
ncbi:MAG: cell wall hydrolase [Clostridia bacterium]|jgi:N-acetylmuramoyl-L-alanine amidase|nr:LysM peptidoglycan-binding domain-containing protein [Clostridiaceae bacterium]